jgi:magnesium transporter
MIQFFKNINHQTVEVDRPEDGTWVNLLPPLKQQEFSQLSEELDIPLDYLTDSLDIDERARFEEWEKIVTINSFENGAIKKFLNTFQNRQADKKNMMVLKIFEKITQTYLEFLKEINQRRNIMEQKLYDSNRNECAYSGLRFAVRILYPNLVVSRDQHHNQLVFHEEEMVLICSI